MSNYFKKGLFVSPFALANAMQDPKKKKIVFFVFSALQRVFCEREKNIFPLFMNEFHVMFLFFAWVFVEDHEISLKGLFVVAKAC